MIETIIFTNDKKQMLVPLVREKAKEHYDSESVLLNVDIYINGMFLDCKFWEITEVEEGAEIQIVPNIHATAIGAAIAGAIGLTAGTTSFIVASTVITAVISIGAGLALNFAMNALFPPEKPKTGVSQDTKSLPLIQGANNAYRPFEPLQQVIGKYRVTPDVAVQPYSVVVNGAQEIRHLFCVSAGDVDVWDIRKDTTSISSLYGIEYYIYNGWRGEPLKWFDTAITPTAENFSTRDYAVFKATSPLNTKGVGFILSFTQGLRANFTETGINYPLSCGVRIKLTNEFMEVVEKEVIFSASDLNATSYREYFYFDLEISKYNIEIYTYFPPYLNVTWESATSSFQYSTEWYIFGENSLVELQWHRDEKAVNYSGKAMTLIELKATASDKLTGSLNTINCMARLKGQKRDGTLVESSNPALLARRLLRDSDITKNTEFVNIDEDSFDSFEAHCDKYGFTANSIETTGRSLGEVLSDVLEIGQGYITGASGVYTIYFDEPTQPYIDIINSRNSWGMTVSHVRNIKNVEGIRAVFNNAEKDYQTDERIVPDGFTGEETEEVRMTYVDNPTLAYKYGMMLLAFQELRNSIFLFNTDWRAIDYKLGQKILVNHSLFFFGIGTAGKVVKHIKNESGMYEAIVLDQFYDTTIGIEYVASLVQKGQTKSWDIKAVDNENTNILYFTVPILQLETIPQIGDELVFGETEKVGVEVLIRNITRNKNYSAEIECVISSEDYYKATQGIIPPFESALTFPTKWDRYKPYTPQITSVNIVRETVTREESGRIKASAMMSLVYIEKNGVDFVNYHIAIKEMNSTQEPTIYTSTEKEKFLLVDIYQDVTYEIKVFATSKLGIDSEDAVFNYYSHELMEALPKVTGFTTVYSNNRIDLVHDNISDWRPFMYEVRRGSTWGNSQLVSKSIEIKALPVLSSGVYHIKAVSGLASSVEVSSLEVESATGEGLPENIIAVVDEESTKWNGITEDFEYIEEENRILLDTGADFRKIENTRTVFDIRTSGYTGQEGIYYVEEDKTILLDNNHSCNISLEFESTAIARKDDFRAIEDIRKDTDIRGNVYTGYYAKVDILVRKSGVWAENWVEFYPSQYVGDGFKFRIRASADENTLVYIEKFIAHVDVPDKIYDYQNVLIPVEGREIEFIPPFNKKPTVLPVILDSTNEFDILNNIELTDRTKTFIQAFDKSGNPAQVHINLYAKGY